MYVKKLFVRNSVLYMQGGKTEREAGASSGGPVFQMADFLKGCLRFEHELMEACPVIDEDGSVLLDDIRPALVKIRSAAGKAKPVDPRKDWEYGLRYHEWLISYLCLACAGGILAGKGISLASAASIVQGLCEEAREAYEEVEKYLDDVITVDSAAISGVPGVYIVYRDDIGASAIVSEDDYDNKGHLLVKDRYEWIPEKKCPFNVLCGPLEKIPAVYRNQMERMEHAHPNFVCSHYLDVPDNEDARLEAEEFFGKFSSVSDAVQHMYFDPEANHYDRAAHLYLDQVIVGYKMTGFKTELWYCPRED